MAWVYVLRGSNGRHCIGSMIDVDRRLHEHRSGETHTTQRLGAKIDLVIIRHLPPWRKQGSFYKAFMPDNRR
jgi:predicted GIY-YIG superfamily endonuclease